MTIEVPSFKLDGNDTLSTTYHPTDSSDFESSSESKPMKTIVPDDQNMAVIGALIGLIVVLSCLFLYLIFPQLVARFKRVMPASKKRVNARYETIEGWLITKRVRAHDENCVCSTTATLSDSPQQNARKTCVDGDIEVGLKSLHVGGSFDTQETTQSDVIDDLECSICMSAFSVNEIVSWSPNIACVHLYHHECIKEWLLRHSNCPCCRQVFLPIDERSKQKLDRTRYKELCRERADRLHRTYVCENMGLIHLDNSSLMSSMHSTSHETDNNSNDRLPMKQLTSSSVRKAELWKLRGSRKEEHSLEGMALEDNSTGSIIDAPALLEDVSQQEQ